MTDYWTLFAAATISLELKCLAQVVYREARGEDPLGQIAVAWVVRNRVEADKWPRTYCGVAKQKAQFYWGGKITDKAAYKEALYYSWRVMKNTVADPTEGSTHFLARRKLQTIPTWTDNFELFTSLGEHSFYR